MLMVTLVAPRYDALPMAVEVDTESVAAVVPPAARLSMLSSLCCSPENASEEKPPGDEPNPF